jgi:hypothetical protein
MNTTTKELYMIRTESLHLREGGDSKPDQTQSDISSNQAQLHDIIQHLNLFSKQQQREQFKGKDAMTLERQMRDIKKNTEKYDKNEKEALQEIIEQRDGKTSSQSEIPLGYQEGLRGGMGARDYLTSSEEHYYDQADADNSDAWTNKERRAVRLYNLADSLIDEGYSSDYIRSTVGERREELQAELPSDDEHAGPSHYKSDSDDEHASPGHNSEDEHASPGHNSDSDEDIDWARKADIGRLVDKLVENPNDWYNKNAGLLPDSDIRKSILDDKLSEKEFSYARKYMRENHDYLSAEADNQVYYLIGAYYY